LHGADDLADQGGLGGSAAESAVEIHHVQARSPLRLPPAGHGHGIVGEDRLGFCATLMQAHAPAAAEVDGGNDQHQLRSSRTKAAKFSSSFSPQRWLFSGWNCVAKSVPRPTAAGKVTPEVQVAAGSEGSVALG